jgi:hypothetical protein
VELALHPAGSGFTTHSRVRKMLASMFAGRRNISATLQDAQQVLTALDSFILAPFLFIMAMISLGHVGPRRFGKMSETLAAPFAHFLGARNRVCELHAAAILTGHTF